MRLTKVCVFVLFAVVMLLRTQTQVGANFGCGNVSQCVNGYGSHYGHYCSDDFEGAGPSNCPEFTNYCNAYCEDYGGVHSNVCAYGEGGFCWCADHGICSEGGPSCNLDPNSCSDGGGWPNWEECACNYSPIVFDLEGNGIKLTSAAKGTTFDLNADGIGDRIAWTKLGSDDAFLVLDRNADGVINNGRELFGSVSPQPPSSEKNGFLALAVFDQVAEGGNGDGRIDKKDQIFTRLRLWRDTNHDGLSHQTELRTLSDAGVRRIDLHYQESPRQDVFGNRFRYKAAVKDNIDHTKWVWDVFLVSSPVE